MFSFFKKELTEQISKVEREGKGSVARKKTIPEDTNHEAGWKSDWGGCQGLGMQKESSSLTDGICL